MKSLLLFVLLLAVGIINAQSYLKMDSFVRITAEEGKFLTEPYKSDVDRYGYNKTLDLLKLDVVRYHRLHEKYNTDLKKKVFINSEEGKKLLAEMKPKCDGLLNQICCTSLGLSNYNLKSRSFKAIGRIWCGRYAKFTNYQSFGIVCLTNFPIQLKKTHFGVTLLSKEKIYKVEYDIPFTDENLALEIEEGKCSLLFVYNIQKVEERATEVFPHDFILGKILGVYLINDVTGKIYKKWNTSTRLMGYESDRPINGEFDVNTKTEEKGILEKELKEEMPQFSGGSVQLWIKENLRYPEIARENNIQGKVYVKCIIDSEGNVCNAEIQRGVDPSLNKEALRLVNSMPKWKPGMQNGKTVSIPYVIIVEFKLN